MKDNNLNTLKHIAAKKRIETSKALAYHKAQAAKYELLLKTL